MRTFIFLAIVFLCNSQAEKTNPIHCSYGSFRCADNSGCVLGKELCDYTKNCNDFSDEGFLLCKEFEAKRGSCETPGELYDSSRGGDCTDISRICLSNYDNGYNFDRFRLLCNYVEFGLPPNDEFFAMAQEISTLREKVSEIRTESQLEDVFELLAASFNESSTVRNDSTCPPLYVNISGKCMALFTVAKVTWAEAKHFCESISGQLAKLGNMKDYESLLKLLKSQGLTTDFWIGGRYAYSTSSEISAWTWLDGQDVGIGAPYWSLYQTTNCTTRGSSPVCYSYSLAPRENRDGFCLALDYAFHYYFIDQNCHEKRSPLCFHNEK